MRLSLAVDFQLLPDPVNLSIVGTGGALGGFAGGLLSWFVLPARDVGERAGEGAVVGGGLALVLLVLGLAGVQF